MKKNYYLVHSSLKVPYWIGKYHDVFMIEYEYKQRTENYQMDIIWKTFTVFINGKYSMLKISDQMYWINKITHIFLLIVELLMWMNAIEEKCSKRKKSRSYVYLSIRVLYLYNILYKFVLRSARRNYHHWMRPCVLESHEPCHGQ